MRKIFLLTLVTIGMIGSSLSQIAIPGTSFADNPARFNGRKVTVKDVQVDFTNQLVGQMLMAPISGPVSTPKVGIVGPINPTNTQTPCNPPRGFHKVDVHFLSSPEYKGCFFMSDPMYNELKRQSGGQKLDAQLTFRGDSRVGYNITFYRLGR